MINAKSIGNDLDFTLRRKCLHPFHKALDPFLLADEILAAGNGGNCALIVRQPFGHQKRGRFPCVKIIHTDITQPGAADDIRHDSHNRDALFNQVINHRDELFRIHRLQDDTVRI